VTLRTLSIISLAIVAAMLSACGSTPSRAPVIERLPSQSARPLPSPSTKATPGERDWRPNTYTVQKGDTLFSIALEHGQDYKDISEWNGIAPPYVIKVGQVLRMVPPEAAATTPLKMPTLVEAKPLVATVASIKTEPKALRQVYSEQALALLEKPAPPPVAPVEVKTESTKVAVAKPVQPPATEKSSSPEGISEDPDKVDWGWPADGKIAANFNDNGSSKGLDIAGTMGQPVLASAAGKVVHTGTTLRGYGKLIIIKHNKSYFSVYAHNSRILVKEGQMVVKGQEIAEMGNTDSDRVMLHFEIRRLGKPVDPLKYLPNDRT
jgi:lipoprotein NlpD